MNAIAHQPTPADGPFEIDGEECKAEHQDTTESHRVILVQYLCDQETVGQIPAYATWQLAGVVC